MPLRSDSYYRRVAEDALSRAAITEPPVTIWDIVERLGIPVRGVRFPLWFTAVLLTEEGMPYVLVNAAKDPPIQAAGVAHVIGHLLIVLADPEASYPRTEGEHHDADVVASELTVPTSMVIEQAQKWFNDYRYLARLFGVTEREMLEKMQQMGIIKERGIYWDY